MPLDFGPTKSMYVDRGQKEVSKILSDRYMTNFLKTDAMQRQAASLTAAPFEGDEALRAEVLQDTDAFLQAAATAGDYENMTTDVVRAASNYQARVQPIQQNQQLWQEYQAQLDEQVAKGDIPLENAERLKKYSRMNYQGLQKDADGNVGGFFQGEAAAIDPNVMKMLDDALKGIKANSGETITKVVGVDTEKGMLEIETASGKEYISMDKVQNVIDPIFADPKVVSFMRQTAELAQIDKSPDQLIAETQGYLEGQKGDLETLQAELANTQDEEAKADLQQRIDTKTEQINRTQTALDSQDFNYMTQNAAAQQMHMDEVRYREAMGAKYTFLSETKKYMEHRDKLALAQAQQVSAGVPPMTHTGEARVIANPMGTTYEEVSNTRSSNIEAANEIMDFLETSPNLSPEVQAGKRAQIQAHLQDVAVASALIQQQFEGLDPSDYDQEEYRRLKQAVAMAQAELNRSLNTNATAGAPVSSLSVARGSLSTLNAATQALEDFMVGAGLKVENPEITFAPEFTTGYLPGYSPNDPVNKEIQEQLIAHYQSGNAKTIFEPNSNIITNLDKRKEDTQAKINDDPNYILQDGDIPPAYKVVSVSVSVSAPGVGGPVHLVTIESTQGPTKGQQTTYTGPGTDINSPQYQEWLNSPSTLLTGHIDKMATVAGRQQFEIPTTDADGDSWKIQVRVVNGERYATFVDSDGGKSREVQVGTAEFAQLADRVNMAYTIQDLTEEEE